MSSSFIMLPRMTPRGGRTGGRTGRGGSRTRGRSGDQGNGGINGQGSQVGGQSNEVNDGVDGVLDLLPTILAQVGNQGDNQGNPRNQNGDAINEYIQGDVRNVIVNKNRRGCTYKEFLACNPKEYDGKGGAIVYTCWIEKMESLQDMSGCEENQKVKYTAGSFVDFKTLTREELSPVNEMQKLETEFWNHAMVGSGHAAYTDRFHELDRLVPYLAGTLTDEPIRNGSLKKNLEKRGNGGEPRDRNARDENKRTRTGNTFATNTNPVRREYNGTIPKCVSYNLHYPLEMPCQACFNYGRPEHMVKDYIVAPRMVNPVNARNPTAAPRVCYECGGTDHFKAACPSNQARGRAFMLGAKEARQDSDIMTGTFTLNDHYATNLFDSGADYSFVSTTFISLLGIEPNELGFSYEIKIASGLLVEIDKVIRGCKLELEDHMFTINLIPFGSGSFDVIIGMDWLSNHKAEIICHENVVRIPLQYVQVLRVIGERPKEKMRHLMLDPLLNGSLTFSL
ncbi:putative reverse transcriptase domain-containing protein [Tanacetum coccineum]